MAIETIIHDGEEKIILSRADYEELTDAHDHAIAMRAVAAGAPRLTGAELDALDAAKTPIAFWRRRAGLTQAALAEAAGISQGFLAQIEQGVRRGGVDLYGKLAAILRLRIEDLLD